MGGCNVWIGMLMVEVSGVVGIVKDGLVLSYIINETMSTKRVNPLLSHNYIY